MWFIGMMIISVSIVGGLALLAVKLGEDVRVVVIPQDQSFVLPE